MNVVMNTATLLTLLTAVVIPAVSALLAKGKVPANVAGLITPMLAAASGFLAEWAQQPNHYDWRQGAINAVMAYVVAVLSHYGLWKGTAAQDALLRVGNQVKS